MRYGEFGVDDIVAYLNQELPGFEPSLLRDDRSEQITLRVLTALKFGAYSTIGAEHLFVPVPRQSYELQHWVDEMVRKTRADMIAKLGLQKQIDEEVKRQIERERKDIEARAHKKAYEEAMATVTRMLAPSVDALRAFVHPEEVFEGDEEVGWDDSGD